MQDYRQPNTVELEAIRKDRELIENNRFWKEYQRRLEYDAFRMIGLVASSIPRDIEAIWKLAMSQGKIQELKRILELPDVICQSKETVK
jgi:hypothetical protein